ncbi:MAG: SDR family NAD(P)-dependent oxidoreductase [candidate division KSB1 bacterium]|nr:SDR family NAD(P)-dependent oxidoreductase [candidate division KSB1 bacterium]MDZ7275825.1 SDR family NAD(P)-dependent oxidoreductase [candidate division KSB1 bacterium]MDZ7287575.1 SDR family NAD(P)-dependent oxidoreductase [candidate division KSB1 bacterium]MDZ7307505.1 SDR family NAD(P)-dependent oxidoreductase [candidate division KSB1 bacterium]MDZ7350553.1 SDR family NAD(P)-dependent oxidoreductase [candidate division KSB1 bacterium]
MLNNTPKDSKELSPLKRAFLKIEEMQARLAAVEAAKREPIAIVGVGCRLPGGVHDPEGFWQLLAAGVDAVQEMPRERWDIEAYYDPNPDTPGKTVCKWGAFLPEVDKFDPAFFGISPREAMSMDPQQRLLLEVVWEALENAGQAPDQLMASRTGVFLAMCKVDYAQMLLKQNDPGQLDTYYASGNAYSTAAGRISYLLGLQGPCLTVDTACSSSLVAVHLACQSLRAGESRMALAGGVNLILSLDNTISFSRSNMLAADGRCKTFDAAADGFVQGEGCVMLVLKRLSDALADGDRIYALIRGSAINQDGASSGLTAPNGPAQEAVIREALHNAGLQPAEVGYVETHGTGTSLGDPIEVQAIGAALAAGHSQEHPLLLGAVKTNLGHLEGAAGVTGLLKAALALQHRQIPPTLHFKTPNPLIPWDHLPVKVVTALIPFPEINGRRVAGVSAFGFSGTNAHVVLEEFRGTSQSSDSSSRQAVSAVSARPRHLLTLSARSEPALQALAQRYEEHLASPVEFDLAAVCRSANTGRAHLSHRLALPVESREELRAKLAAFGRGQLPAGCHRGQVVVDEAPQIAFLFTGQGAQYPGMGRRLYETQPVFRRALEQCQELLRPHLQKPLLSVMFSDPAAPETVHELHQTAYTQPALFALEYALAELWRAWGVKPAAVLGHSVGEYAAACVAGVFDLADALKLIAARGRLMQEKCVSGTMASITASEAEVAAALAGHSEEVAIAALNGPDSTVISGETGAVERLCRRFEAEGRKTRRLTVSHAFHSPLMEPMLEEFTAVAAQVKYAAPRLGLLSNVTGRFETGAFFSDPGYWRRHVRSTVRFADAMRALHDKGYRIFLEVGPHPTLLGMGTKCFPAGTNAGEPCLWLPSLRQGRDDWQQMLDSLAALYVNGVAIDWAGFEQDTPRHKVTLPTYPFQRRRFWFEQRRVETQPNAAGSARHPLLGQRVQSPLLKEVLFETQVSVAAVPFLGDHVVHGLVVMPTTAYLEMILAAATALWGEDSHLVQDMDLREAMTFEAGECRTVQMLLSPAAEGARDFQIISFSGASAYGADSYKVHAAGKMQPARSNGHLPAAVDPAALRERLRTAVPVPEYYEHLRATGLQFGPRFLGIVQLWRQDGEVLGEIHRNDTIAGEAGRFHIHPALLDACLQISGALLAPDHNRLAAEEIFMPIGLEAFRLFAPAPAQLFSHAVLRPHAATPAAAAQTRVIDFHIYDAAGNPVAELLGLQVKRVAAALLQRAASAGLKDWLYEVKWLPQPLAGKTATAAAPDFLPDSAPLSAHLQAALPDLSARHNFAVYDELLPRLDALSTAYIVKALRDLGWEFTPGRRFEAGALAARLGVVQQHQRLFHRLLEILAEDGILRRRESDWEVRQAPAPGDPESLAAEFVTAHAELTLLRRGGENLAEVLRGRCDPLQVLFPGGSFDLAEKLYRESPAAKVYNGLARRAIAQIVASLPANRTLRVLEVGAGTGGTTSFILPEFPAQRTEYTFTDLSPLFLTRAREDFAAHSFLRYELLDIEQDPEQQGFRPHGYDLIIAANVVHATRDLRQTLRHLRQLLAPRGLLLLLEGMQPQRWIDLTFGMTEGWWRFTDLELRPNYPLLPPAAWFTLLRELGFEQIETVPAQQSGRAWSQNALLLSRAPGGLAIADRKDAWLIFADQGGVAQGLAQHLQAQGERCVLVSAGESFAASGNGSFRVARGHREDYQRLVQEAFVAPHLSCRGVVHLWPADDFAGDQLDLKTLIDAQERGSRSLLALLQALLTTPGFETPEVWVVTRTAQPVTEAAQLLALPHAPIWGFGRALALEHPELRCVRLDLDAPAHLSVESQLLLNELLHPDGEEQVAYRNGQRYVARLARRSLDFSSDISAMANAGETAPVQLEIVQPGVLEGLKLKPASRRPPGPHEIELRVAATGLNFRDVLNALGMRRDEDPLGGEVAGTVVRVGSAVKDFKVGDEVIAVTVGGFSTFLTTFTALTVKKPAGLDFAAAATIPLAYLTAAYALHSLGRLQRGERVLIHAAAGGVGMAAVQLARRAGAEIFATAGSAEKRDYLKGLGIAHVFNSRTLDFADEIRRITAGEGLDLVLNSLTGEFIPASLRLLRSNGRFLEIGKKEIWSAAQVAAVNPHATYFAVDLAEKIKRDPAAVRPQLLEIMQAIANGELQPLPHTTFALAEAAAAFRYMAQAKHIGKVVVTQQGAGGKGHGARGTRQEAGIQVRGDATYLITGGLRGLGLLTAEWLVERGCRHLALLGRSAPAEASLAVIRKLKQAGCRVLVMQGDVAKPEEVARCLQQIQTMLPPLRGLIHSAGVLDDGVLLQQSWERFLTVMAPKVFGAWNLHVQTRELPLDFFVIYSSVSALLGTLAQVNHASANAFLDALAHHRAALGLPAMSINWGAWSEIGAAARHNVGDRIVTRGINSFTPQQGLQVLAMLFERPVTQVGVMPVNWTTFADQFTGRRLPAYFSELVAGAQARTAAPATPSPGPRNLLQELQQATPARRRQMLLAFVEAQAQKVLSMEASQTIHEKQPLTDLGLDSLMAVELRNLLGAGLGLERPLPATLVFDHPTTAALANYFLRTLFATDTPPAAAPSPAPAAMLESISQLSDEEVDRLLAEKMAGGN